MSTEKQAETGLSLDAQTAKIRAMAEVRGVTMTAVFVDAGASAKSLDRPRMTRLLDLVEMGAVSTIIIAKLDRLTRSIRDLAELLQRFERRKVSLISVAETLDTGSAAGRAMLKIMVTMSEWEREAIGERTRDVLRHKRTKGERTGTLPFGFELVPGSDSQLQAAPVEQRLLARILALRAAGFSTRQIAAELNGHGWTTRNGTAWRFEYVARRCRNNGRTDS